MDKETFDKKVAQKMETISWLKSFTGFPSEMAPKNSCPRCKIGVVFGVKNSKGEVENIISEETGSPLIICGDCQIDIQKSIDQEKILKKSYGIKQYEERISELNKNLSKGQKPYTWGDTLPSENKKNKRDRGF